MLDYVVFTFEPGLIHDATLQDSTTGDETQRHTKWAHTHTHTHLHLHLHTHTYTHAHLHTGPLAHLPHFLRESFVLCVSVYSIIFFVLTCR